MIILYISTVGFIVLGICILFTDDTKKSRDPRLPRGW
jgi:hypothetical protein